MKLHAVDRMRAVADGHDDPVLARACRHLEVGRNIGAHVETLQRGSRSSERHWHEEKDEFLCVISGEATVIEEGKTEQARTLAW